MTKKTAHEWDLSPLIDGDITKATEQDRQAVEAAVRAFAVKWRDRVDYLTEITVLREALDEYESLQAKFGSDGASGYYWWLRQNQNQLDVEVKAQFQKSVDFATRMQNEIQFFELALGTIAAEHQKAILSSSELESYRHFLERVFVTARYTLSEPEERIMNAKSTTSYSKWVELTENALTSQERETTVEDGTKQVVPLETLMSLISHQDKTIRDEAAENLNDALRSVRKIAEAEINAILANHKVDDEMRGFTRPDQYRHVADDIETETVDAMLEAVSARNDVAQRFYDLKAKLLGQTTLAYHERNIEYGDVDQTYDWEAGVKVVDEVYSALEPRFGEIFRMFRDNNQIDVYPRKGKTGGAFCVHFLKSQPTYLLLNYTDKLRDVTTLAHELGHGLNNEYMREAQNALGFGTTLATAEVASQYLEDFVMDRLMESADDETRLAINMTRLNDAISSIFRQTACYRFEQSLHNEFREVGYLSVDRIGELFTGAMKSYMGPAVEQSPGSENWWIYWGHIRRFFYVYSYSSGLLIAKAMQKATRADSKFISKVAQFLSAGRSASPKDVFATMDIEITDVKFWNDGIDEVEALLNETTELARKLGKI